MDMTKLTDTFHNFVNMPKKLVNDIGTGEEGQELSLLKTIVTPGVPHIHKFISERKVKNP
jgi:hypothetical protein